MNFLHVNMRHGVLYTLKLLAQVIDQDHNDCVIGFDELQCLGDDE